MVIGILAMVSIIHCPILKEEKVLKNSQGLPIVVKGKIIEKRELTYGSQYIIKPKVAYIDGEQRKIKGLLRIDATQEANEIVEGDTISSHGKIESLSFQRNPGGFDERKYLLMRNVVSKIKADTIKVEYNAVMGGFSAFKKIQKYYSDVFEIIIPWDKAQIMKSMLIGDQSLLLRETQQLYQKAGIAHLLAISGLHISVITSMLWWVLKKTRIPDNIGIIVLIVMLWIYASITGFSVSITRAVIMSTIMFLGRVLDEKSDNVTSLCFAAFILLLWNNLYLWDIGFQLSFSAVASLVFLTPLFEKIYFVPKKLRKTISPVIAVMIGTMPLLAYYYYTISLIGVLLNILLIPIATGVIIIGFIAMIAAPIHLTLAKWTIGSGYYLLVLIEKISKIGLSIPGSTLIVGKPKLIELLLYTLFCAIICLYLSATLEQRKDMKKHIVLGCISIILIFFIQERWPQNLEVTFLDVGQGDCIIIQTPFHQTFILDGGGQGSGKKIEGFLKYKGVSSIDAIILSHTHSDHMEGLRELIEIYPTQKILLSELPLDDELFMEFYDTINMKGIPVGRIGAGDVIKIKDIFIECISPPKGSKFLSSNNASVVLVLKYGSVSYYFTGDIETPYEEELNTKITRNVFNILKVPHHGSKTSSTEEFLSHIRPDIAIISCSEKNIYGHPSQEVLDRYKNRNIPMLMTKEEGAIITTIIKNKVVVDTMKNKETLWK